MLRALGIEYDGRHKTHIMPAPLQPGEAQRIGTDGVSLWNPPWLEGADHPSCKAFINHVVSLILQNELALGEDKVM